MASQDPNPQGGSITDMAAQGTKVPDDAATQNTIPSVPRPDQTTDSSNDSNDLGTTDLAGVADNAQDVSRVRLYKSSTFPNVPLVKDHDARLFRLIFCLPNCRLHVILPLLPKLLPAPEMLCLRRLARSVFTTM